MKSKVDIKVIYAVIAAIVILEGIALFKGINGTLFSMVMLLLGSIAGIQIPKEKIFKN